VEKEPDPVARERLAAALTLLDQQREQRRELGTAADRLEAEYTRLYYTLENLHAQVLRARSADALAAETSAADLRQSLEKLGDEVDAVTDALEGVHRGDLQPISEAPDASPPSSGTRTRE
jgi:chromosome segregation ATPase